MPSLDWYDCPIVLPYYGGKYEMSKKLIPLLPPHERYIEVFAGGLSMFFRKAKAKWNVLNDKDKIKNLEKNIYQFSNKNSSKQIAKTILGNIE